ncbi:LacI family DNA-binding transcriptional regulator [Glycomyces tenuis]|uniref:LacI family DNA-binding transcriptional regulator n=2 Tax=Glycomyces tenuis TaxID=58116 RepID=UPI000401F076|nr:LacI family DNA-binding transcriptional regulator [Glycomyces tenuis]
MAGSESSGRRTLPKPKPSMGDVAALAGVSSQTVSRVSMGATNVRPATRDRVLAAMSELGYSPNSAARALRYGAFRTIGIIAHQLSRTGESRTVEAVVEAAQREGHTVTVVDVESPVSTEVSEAAARLSQQSIDGLVIIRAETVTPDMLTVPRGLPVVVSDSRFVGRHPAVGADQIDGSRRATEHLLALGHRTVHHVAGPADSGPTRLRIEGWRGALEDAGREAPEIVRGEWTAASGYEAGRRIAREPGATAVFCANDEMAAGVLHALHEAGRRVPGEVSVVGFDGIALGAHLWPPLTTVRQDFAEIGTRLVDLLMRQVRGGEPLEDVHELVPVELIVRQSTAPPP